MARIISFLIPTVLLFTSISHADSVTREETLFARPDTGTIDEDKLLTVHFIDVGAGDAILINTPSDKKILIDGGWNYRDRGLAEDEYTAYLNKFLADDIVDLIVISHPDYDHFAGLDHVLDRYVVRQVWYNGYDSNDLSSSWKNLINKIAQKEDLIFLSPIRIS